MSIRWKLLLLLVSVTLIPIMVLRWHGARNITKLEKELVGGAVLTLEKNAQKRLLFVVEQHARDLRHSGHYLESLLEMQRSEIEEVLMGRGQKIEDLINSLNSRQVSPGHTEKKYWKITRKQTSIPLQVDLNRVRMLSSNNSEITNKELTEKLFLGIYQSIFRGNEEAVLWLETTFKNGSTQLYPFVDDIPKKFSPLSRKWYQNSLSFNGTVWTIPDFDPITKRLTATISTTIVDREMNPVGATCIKVPLDNLVSSGFLNEISQHAQTYLVHLPNTVSNPGNELQLIAARYERNSTGANWQVDIQNMGADLMNTPQAVDAFKKQISTSSSGMGAFSTNGTNWLWAFSKLSDNGEMAFLTLVPRKDVIADADEIGSRIKTHFSTTLKATGFVITVTLVIVLLLSFFLSKRVTDRIVQVARAVRQVAKGNFSITTGLTGKDEISQLGRDFDQMIPAMQERIDMKQALDVAQEIQTSFLPKKQPDFPGFDIFGVCIYCDETGGDFYDFIPLPDKNHFYITIGDISGHGIPSALLMATVRAHLRNRLLFPGKTSQIMGDVNFQVTTDTFGSGRFCTQFLLCLNRDLSIQWSSAGHDPTMVYTPGTNSWQHLGARDIPLGVEESWEFEEGESTLKQGDILVLGTDGIWEMQSEKGIMYGKERLQEIIEQNHSLSAQKISEMILADMSRFRGAAKVEDDVTLIVVRVS